MSKRSTEVTLAMKSQNVFIGVFFAAFALAVLLAWVPIDTATSYIEKVRGRSVLGDALAPSIAAGFVLLGSLLLLFKGHEHDPDRVAFANFRFLALIGLVVAVSFALMRWTGPLAVGIMDAFTSDDLSYRPLRDTAPWKYLGFVAGGTFMISCLISLVEHRLSWRAVLIALTATLVMIAIFDLPFDDLLLPPNGDV